MKKGYFKWLKKDSKRWLTTLAGFLGLFALAYYIYSIFIEKTNGETVWQSEYELEFYIFAIATLNIILGFSLAMIYHPYSIYKDLEDQE